MPTLALQARYVFPVAGGPIDGGRVVVEGERIAAVGRHAAAEAVEDLGNVAILPGLINAHTHLEFSDCEKPLGWPGIGFADWIRQTLDYRRNLGGNGRKAIENGLRECTRRGVTTLGDISQPESPPSSSNSIFDNSGLDGTAFVELIAPTADRISAVLQTAQKSAPNLRHGKMAHRPFPARPLQRPYRLAPAIGKNFRRTSNSLGDAPGRIAKRCNGWPTGPDRLPNCSANWGLAILRPFRAVFDRLII